MNALVPISQSNAEIYRASTDAADLCRAIVLKTAMEIQDRKYVKVEGWQAIAIAHGCTAGAREVERVDGGVRAIGEVRRMSDGGLIAQAEGFVGEDEPTWFGGVVEKDEWSGPRGSRRKTGKKIKTELPKRPDYAIRAMAQTRAISRACRSAFAHVVVMIDAGLSTTPAEEVPLGGFDDEPRGEPRNVTPRKDDDLPSLAVTAAQTAITCCNNREELSAWKAKNDGMLDGMDAGQDYDAILDAYKARWAAFAPSRHVRESGADKPVNGARPAEPTPFDDEDSIPY